MISIDRSAARSSLDGESQSPGSPVFPTIEPPYRLFIADLHLSEKTPELCELFAALARSDLVARAESLIVLGDLFDFWLGDDMLDESFYRFIGQLIAGIVVRGTPCFFMVGNRDFLVGDRFYRETGMNPLDDPSVMDLYGKRTLLTHGDRYCIGDFDYQKFRKEVRKSAKRRWFLALPRFIRRWIHRLVVSAIAYDKSKDPRRFVDLDLETLSRAMDAVAAVDAIHGHTHRPAVHEEPFGRRAVIADWRMTDNGPLGGVFVVTPDAWVACPIAFSSRAMEAA